MPLFRYMRLIMASVAWLLGNVFLTLATALLWHIANPVQRWRFRKFPGPPPLPLLGNYLDLIRRGRDKTLSFWSEKYGPIYVVWLGSTPTVVVACADALRDLTQLRFTSLPGRFQLATSMPSDSEAFTQRSNSLFSVKGEAHKSLRSAMLPLFHAASLERLAGMMTSSADILVGHLRTAAASGEVVDLHSMFGHLTLDVISAVIAGQPLGALAAIRNPKPDPLVSAMAEFFALVEPVSGGGAVNDPYALAMFLLPHWMHPAVQAVARIKPAWRVSRLVACDGVVRDEAKRVVAAAREGPPAEAGASPTLLHTMLQARKKDGEAYSDAEIVSQSILFYLAGYETTSSALAHTIYLLCTHSAEQTCALAVVDEFTASQGGRVPDARDIPAHLPYLAACVAEALRVMPPASLIVRQADRDCVIGGFCVPKGTNVFGALTPVLRNPMDFAEPSAFRPKRHLAGSEEAAARHPTSFVPFGSGPRSCIGAKLALQEAVLALARLYEAVLPVLEPGQVPLALREGITNVPARGLWVRLQRRGSHVDV